MLRKLLPRNFSGFTLLEMVIVIVLIGILGLIILSRVWKYRVYAEQAVVATTVGNIRSALGLEVARLAVRGRAGDIASLANTNPMHLMAQTPDSYLGEMTDAGHIKDTGVWYFDATDHTLNYIVNYSEYFQSTIQGIPRTRHQIKLVYTDNNRNQRFDKGIDDINGLDLVALEQYQWNIEK